MSRTARNKPLREALQHHYRTIIWDWNGTLLDDVDISIAATNMLLEERGLPLLDKKRYQEVFDFPVKDYYARIGFDFSKYPFEIPGKQFMANYKALSAQARLNGEALSTLMQIRGLGCQQLMLSAMEDSLLKKMIADYGLTPYLDHVFGIADDFANTKVYLGKRMVMQMNIDPRYTLMVGDTLHDAEVATECGFDCVLFSGGHFLRKRLESSGRRVIDSLDELIQDL
ncbi:MAG: HAD family hydrolase [Candidatus Limimorpha sp.]